MAAKANYSKKPANKKVVEETQDVVKTEVKPVETKQETKPEAVKEAAPAVTTAAPAATPVKWPAACGGSAIPRVSPSAASIRKC